MRIIIIGNSAAALAAVETLRSLGGGRNEILMLAAGPAKAYARCLLADLLAGKKTEPALQLRPDNFYPKLGVTLFTGRRVVELDPHNKQVILQDGAAFSYDRLLLATGASPMLPELPGTDAEGVFTLRSLADVRGIKARVDQTKQAVVLGGGLVGLKAACGLKAAGVAKVKVLVTSSRLLSRQLDQQAASMVEAELKKYGIEVVYQARAKSLLQSDRHQLTGVELTDGTELAADLALIAKGVKPNSELVAKAGGLVGRGIQVDNYLKTSLADVYAAGDCIEVTDRLTGQQVNSALWTLAYEQGRYAAANLLGHPRPYPTPLTRLNSATFGSLNVIAVGCQEGSLVIGQQDRQTYRRLVFEGKRLMGFILVGNVEGAGVYTALVKTGVSAEKHRDDLLAGRTGKIALSCLK